MTVEIDQTLKTLRQNLLLWKINDEKWNRRKNVWEKRQVRRNARKRNRGREDLEEEKYRKNGKAKNERKTNEMKFKKKVKRTINVRKERNLK